ncbi:MAG TPA: LCP family protein [Candidatus Butyricicoccus avistercoris]|uniref:LCP family protein n=1 Tax=Candidatus Butyricicoccus avistercoris TaxID=2838518 RepID=A0A9D1PIY1_9FIRM|nr:LCP family protein [Candidatus Butyricicoccus avistercoris]
MTLRRFFRILRRWTFLAIIIAGLFFGGKFVYNSFFSYTHDNSLDNVSDEELAVNVKPQTGVTNIALFGVDTRSNGEPVRSDSMMVMSVDSDNGTIKLVSLMRDSRVEVEDHGTQKLCHAYSFGGAKLAIKTINQSFGLDITDYAEVNFQQMAELIEAIGGVNIDVSDAERKEANKYITEYYESYGLEPILIEQTGYQRLNGVQAMTYARIRKGGTGDDWGRVERQGIVLNAMFAEIKNKSLPELITLMPKLMPYITTSLTKTEMISLAKGALSKGIPEIEHYRVPEDGQWNYGGSHDEYIVYDLNKAAETIDNYLYT